MSGLNISKAQGFTLHISDNAPTVPLYTRPAAVATHLGILATIISMFTRTDRHRKLSGHMVLIVTGLILAGLEIHFGISPLWGAATQAVLPSACQEVYDFIKGF
jgi:hypothetical protein